MERFYLPTWQLLEAFGLKIKSEVNKAWSSDSTILYFPSKVSCCYEQLQQAVWNLERFQLASAPTLVSAAISRKCLKSNNTSTRATAVTCTCISWTWWPDVVDDQEVGVHEAHVGDTTKTGMSWIHHRTRKYSSGHFKVMIKSSEVELTHRRWTRNLVAALLSYCFNLHC